MLVHEGHLYHMNQETEFKKYWRCVNYPACKGRITEDLQNEYSNRAAHDEEFCQEVSEEETINR